jgi:hypothetical protein
VLGRSLVQRSPNEFGVSECDKGTSKRRPWPTVGVKKKKKKDVKEKLLKTIPLHGKIGGKDVFWNFYTIVLDINDPLHNLGPGSSVGIATGYGMDGPGIESRWGARFSAPVQIGPGTHPASCTMCTGSFPGVKSGRCVTLTPHHILVPWS